MLNTEQQRTIANKQGQRQLANGYRAMRDGKPLLARSFFVRARDRFRLAGNIDMAITSQHLEDNADNLDSRN